MFAYGARSGNQKLTASPWKQNGSSHNRKVIRMRVTLVISSLSGGGAARVMSIMASYWATKGWRVTLVTFDHRRVVPAYPLHVDVVHCPLAMLKKSSRMVCRVGNSLRRLWVLRRTVARSAPHVVISFLDVMNVRTLLATFALGYPVIVSERTIPSLHTIGILWNAMRRWCYPHANRVIVQTRGALLGLSARRRRNVCVIPNPVVPPESVQSRTNRRAQTIIGMGRLSREKGFDMLLLAFAQLAPKHPNWSLVIWGEGPLLDRLEKLRDDLELRQRASFCGRTSRPFDEMQRGALFVLSSRYEGFPNVLCEAMASGLPAVSFECPWGPAEIIRDGVDGVLVPHDDVDTLAQVMDRLMGDQSERERLAKRAREVVVRFGLESVMGLWETVIFAATRDGEA